MLEKTIEITNKEILDHLRSLPISEVIELIKEIDSSFSTWQLTFPLMEYFEGYRKELNETCATDRCTPQELLEKC